MARPPSAEVLARRIRRWEEHPDIETTPTAQMGRRLLSGETVSSLIGPEHGVTEGAFSMVIRDMKKAGYTFRKTRDGMRLYYTLSRRPSVDFDLELEPRPPERPTPEPRRIQPGELHAARPSQLRQEVTWGSFAQVRREAVPHRGTESFQRAGWDDGPMETQGAVGEWQHPPLGSSLQVRALALTDEGVLVQMVGAGGAWQAVITGHVAPGE